MDKRLENDQGFVATLIGDGRPLLTFAALLLILSGLFAMFQSATKHFLPHDVAYLGMTAEELCAINECRIVHFMIHDRVSFGGSLVAIGILYLWLVAFPLSQGRAWAWLLLLVSALFGFASFLAYLGYGYLDTWHGAGTMVLLPIFAWGLVRTYGILDRPISIPSLGAREEMGTGTGRLFGFPASCAGSPEPVPISSPALAVPAESIEWRSGYGLGKALLLATGVCLTIGGLIIMTVGMTTVFVPQDLQFMAFTVDDLHAVNPRLVPLIAHDRAGFGGGVACCGLTLLFCVWCGLPSKSLWQALLGCGLFGFGAAIFVHPAVGYNDLVHIAPACLGALMFVVGMILTYRRMNRMDASGCASLL